MSEYPLAEETAKYDTCYSLENYHLQGQRLLRVQKDIAKMESGKTYLDVGCGRGEMVKLANSRGVTACGLELVPKLCDGVTIKQGSVLDIGYADKTFDYVSCYDMIEHLPPEYVDKALDELFRVTANTLYITTNDKRSHLGDLELHLTRRPRPWWTEKLVERARVRGNWQMIEDTYGITNEEWHWEIRLDQ
jgi:ubiquinone/menaquinone biosynthesis C-methylase UbiE